MAKKKKIKKLKSKEILATLIIIILIMLVENIININQYNNEYNNVEVANYSNIGEVPEYSEAPYVTINNNIPYFTENDYTTEGFEKYSSLDKEGRCGIAYANLCKELMPKDGEERQDINMVKPTGWIQKKYGEEYLYNRCHLIGYQLSAENANEKNLITGTRYFNVDGMLPFENEVATYIRESKENVHVLYRVTPIFEGDNLLASGVQMEAYSVEDEGKGVCFNVYVYNVQPGISINYKTGQSYLYSSEN